MSDRRSALLLGATGLIGGHCLRLLLGAPAYDRVHVLVRRAIPVSGDKLTVSLTDFERLRDHPEAFSVDDIFCCLGTTIKAAGSQEAFRKVDFGYIVEAARLGVRCGAQRFLVVSSLGANVHSRVFYSRVKGETEEALRAMGYARLAIFRPSMLLGGRREVRNGETAAIAATRILSVFMVGSLRKYRPVEAELVARAMLVVAGSSDAGAQVFESDRIRELGTHADGR